MYTDKPNRLQGFDYASDRLYFITSVVENRIPCFGKIVKGEMILNDYGTITYQQLRWLQEQYSYVILHEHVVMPDHVHAIIEINSIGCSSIKIKSLSELIGAFKMTASKQIHLNGQINFKWQRSFHDRIIRNQSEFDRIGKYIRENPINASKND